MNNENGDNNNFNDDTTIYFSDDRNYEASNTSYTEEDMYENYRPLSNVNSVEYDENDYESNYEDEEEPSNNRQRIIIGYIVSIIIIVIIIVVAFLKVK